jgi:alginate O-acetyltransferase complex protein AlgI
MILTAAWVWFFAFFLHTLRLRWIAIVMIVLGPMGVLFLFKYLHFALDSLVALDGLFLARGLPAYLSQFAGWVRSNLFMVLAITLPAGISFYSFQILSYGIDVYRGKDRIERNPLMLTLYVAFFPHLIAGPIMRYDELVPQLRRLAVIKHLTPNFYLATKYLTIGLIGKMFFADIPSTFLEDIKATQYLTSTDALFYVLVRTIQIYFDFWGYSLMAIGLAKMFAVELPKNFDEPYISLNPQEFWRRWHITLSTWMRDYVYVTLGGRDHYIRNILIVFALVGLWHGAGWNFIVWGLWHGVLISAYHLSKPIWDRLPTFLAIAMTFTLIGLGWPLFFLSLTDFYKLISTLLSLNLQASAASTWKWLYVFAILALVFGVRERYWVYGDPKTFLPVKAAALGVAFVACLLFFQYRQTFIYYRF